MRRLPRERFLPHALVPLAYADEDVPLGNGRFMLEPMVLAKLLQAATLLEHERVLVVGAGTGYGAAVLAACGCRVVALEEDPALLAIAETFLPQEAPGVTLASGPLSAGWPGTCSLRHDPDRGCGARGAARPGGAVASGNRAAAHGNLLRRPRDPGGSGRGDGGRPRHIGAV